MSMHASFDRWWNGISLRAKITGVTVLLLTFGLTVAGAGTMTVLRTYLLEQTDQQIAAAYEKLPPKIDLEHDRGVRRRPAPQPVLPRGDQRRRTHHRRQPRATSRRRCCPTRRG